MHFCFYPKHEFGCPHVDHCPHLGGASLGSLVYAADEQTEWTDSLWRQIDALQAENTAKYHKIEEQAARIEQLERELKAERQKQFKAKKEEPAPAETDEAPAPGPKKRGGRKAIQAGIASGLVNSISWWLCRPQLNVHTAMGRSRPGPIARCTIISRKTGSTASGS